MSRCVWRGRMTTVLASQAVLASLLAGTGWAQTTVDPQVIEFIPSGSNALLLSDGTPALSGYDLEITVAGTTQVLQRISLGKPANDPDGMIRVNFASRLTSTPVPGTSYDSRILTVGPTGTTPSSRSGVFTFSACQNTLSSPSASFGSTGGTGSVSLTASASWCGWTAVSSAPWLQLTSAGSGQGSATTAFTVAANTTGSARSASIAFGPLTFAVTQKPAATPQTLDIPTEADLQAAVASLASNTTLRLAPGTYRLSATLQLRGPLSGVVLMGSTGRASDVTIEGQGMTVNGTVPTAISVSGAVQGLTIADLTIRNVYRNAVFFDNGPQAPRLSNLSLVDCGDACVKANLSTGAPSVDDGIVEKSWIGYSSTGATVSAGGIDLRGSRRWSVRHNTFQNVRGPSGQNSRPALGASSGASDTLVQANVFINNSTAIALGLTDLGGAYDHSAGRVSNNFVYRDATVAGGPGISVADSPTTVVAFNTVVLSNTYASPIEYRYSGAANLTIANNLTDGAITARDGAAAALAGNVTSAAPAMFVNPSAGDLHLRPTATGAIDVADLSVQEQVDMDDESRPKGQGPDVGADEVTSTSAAPIVQVTDPANGTIYRTGSSLQMQAQAQGSGAAITSVQFYVNSTLVATDTSAPYVAAWTPTRNGTYSIVAVATDSAGSSASSPAVTITANKKGR